jgi:hypothetical protein
MDEDSESDTEAKERVLADEIRAKRKIVVSIARVTTVRSKVWRQGE